MVCVTKIDDTFQFLNLPSVDTPPCIALIGPQNGAEYCYMSPSDHFESFSLKLTIEKNGSFLAPIMQIKTK